MFWGLTAGRRPAQRRRLLYGRRQGAASPGWHSGIIPACASGASVTALIMLLMEKRGELKA